MNLQSNAPERNKFESIQVLRFIAAFMVVVLHAGIFTADRLKPGFPIYYAGANGVRLFFVISGFVMIVSSKNLVAGARSWRTFAAKRIQRIVPIYWLLNTVKVILLLVGSGIIIHAKLDWIYILKSYFFIPAKNAEGYLRPLQGVGWTLNYEMFFYLLFTLALIFRIRPILFLTATIIPMAIGSFFKTAAWPSWISFYFDPILLDFLYGILAGTLIMQGRKLPRTISYLLLALGIGTLFIPSAINTGSENDLLMGVAALAIVYSTASLEIPGKTVMPRRLVYLGAASYSLYLIHPMIAPIVPALLAKIHLQQQLLSVILTTAVSILGGYLFYRYCEQPITGWLTGSKKKKIQTAPGNLPSIQPRQKRPASALN